MAGQPPDFNLIADAETKRAFMGGRPEAVVWLDPGTKLFKWTQALPMARGRISPWWQFLEKRALPNGVVVPGLKEMRAYAQNTASHPRDFNRVRLAVTEQWNQMTHLASIQLLVGVWGYVGKAFGQRKDLNDPQVIFIGGGYQVWIPNLQAEQARQITLIQDL